MRKKACEHFSSVDKSRRLNGNSDPKPGVYLHRNNGLIETIIDYIAHITGFS
jgi:hypothetical protein